MMEMIISWIGKKWLEKVFSEQLEKNKHALEKQLEDHKHKINALFDRITKIHEKEFEVLPECWYKLIDALGASQKLTAQSRSVPNLNRYTPEALKEFVEGLNWTENEKSTLLASSDKNQCYLDTCYGYALFNSRKEINIFHDYVIKNKIFLNSDLYQLFDEVDKLLWGAVSDYEIAKQERNWKWSNEVSKKVQNEIPSILKKIEDAIQK